MWPPWTSATRPRWARVRRRTCAPCLCRAPQHRCSSRCSPCAAYANTPCADGLSSVPFALGLPWLSWAGCVCCCGSAGWPGAVGPPPRRERKTCAVRALSRPLVGFAPAHPGNARGCRAPRPNSAPAPQGVRGMREGAKEMSPTLGNPCGRWRVSHVAAAQARGRALRARRGSTPPPEYWAALSPICTRRGGQPRRVRAQP